jgi:hypothetical protein
VNDYGSDKGNLLIMALGIGADDQAVFELQAGLPHIA